MPFYEYVCTKCGTKAEVFARSVTVEVVPPKCEKAGREKGHEMRRIISQFVRHRTIGDQLAEAEAKWGKEVESALGPEPDIAKYANRYERLAKDLPPEKV